MDSDTEGVACYFKEVQGNPKLSVDAAVTSLCVVQGEEMEKLKYVTYMFRCQHVNTELLLLTSSKHLFEPQREKHITHQYHWCT